MAIRNIVKEGDPILNKVCRPVTNFDDRLATLLDDMRETMIAADGVGLAGPQVGMMRRLFVVWDTTDAPEEIPEDYEYKFIDFVNPEILAVSEEEETAYEGCLSFPGHNGAVTRPIAVKVRAQDRNGEWFELEADGLLGRHFSGGFREGGAIIAVVNADQQVTFFHRHIVLHRQLLDIAGDFAGDGANVAADIGIIGGLHKAPGMPPVSAVARCRQCGSPQGRQDKNIFLTGRIHCWHLCKVQAGIFARYRLRVCAADIHDDISSAARRRGPAPWRIYPG